MTDPPAAGEDWRHGEPSEGWIAGDLAAEFPDLKLLEMTVPARDGRSGRDLRERLRAQARRWYGAKAIAVRSQPVPQAFRVFFRQIGLDPDATRTPMEQVVLDRLMHGDLRSRGVVADAVTLAIIETGVPVWALDHDALDGALGLRGALPGERLGEGPYADDQPPGRLVLADGAGPVSVLFGDVAPSRAVSRPTRAVRLCSMRVAGVPEVHAEEALWLCAEALTAAGEGR